MQLGGMNANFFVYLCRPNSKETQNAIKATKIDFRSMFRFAADHVNELDSSFADKYRQLNTPTVNYADTLFDPHVSLFTLDHTLPVSACVPIINNLYTVIKAKRFVPS